MECDKLLNFFIKPATVIIPFAYLVKTLHLPTHTLALVCDGTRGDKRPGCSSSSKRKKPGTAIILISVVE